MPKRKKHPKLPNSFGSVRYLGKKRSNAYAVHPPCVDIDDKGDYVRPPAICYVDDWYVGFAVLNAYHAGTYKPGDELLFKAYRDVSSSDLDAFCSRLLTDFSAHQHAEEVRKENEKTFAQVYDAYYAWKFKAPAPGSDKKPLSKSYQDSIRAAYKHCAAIQDRIFSDLRYQDLKDVIDDCPKKLATKENIAMLIKQMYDYADMENLCEKNYAQHITADGEPDEHGVPFTDSDLKKLWKHKEDSTVEMILIMCYSGYRISAYPNLKVDLEKMYFQGGVKTSAGKDRVVPIHSAIQKLVAARMKRDKTMLDISSNEFRVRMYEALEWLKIEKHTPHDCRHTFSKLCEKYKVAENDRKRMLGHAFTDVTNKVYGHRDLEDLRTEIEKIKVDL